MSNSPEIRDLELCFLDVETTGRLIGYHEIIEIAAVRTTSDAGEIVGEWHKRIRPEHPERMSDYARSLTRYTADGWAGAEEPSRALWSEFVGFVSGCVPVCHNPSFERAFISLAALPHGIHDLGLDYHWIGTESLAWPLYKLGNLEKLSLKSLCEFFNVGVEPEPHTALEGAQACWRVYKALTTRLGK